MSEYDLDSTVLAFKLLISELDQQRNGNIEANELFQIFKKYDFQIDQRKLMELFPEGKTKIKYEYLGGL